MRGRFKLLLAAAIAAASFALAASNASAAGYSSFFNSLYGCHVEGVTKTYYDGGSSSTRVAVRGRFFGSGNYGASWYQIAGPTERFASGSGGGEARVAWEASVGNQPVRIEGRHWGTPWGDNNYLDAANSGVYGCG